MKLLLPAVSVDDIMRLKELAPDAEFYTGIQLEDWKTIFGENAELNRMSSFGKTANATDIESFLNLCKATKGSGIYLTLNAPSYSANQLAYLDNFLSEISECVFAGVIISDPALVDIAFRHGLKAIASTMTGIYNADLARWYVNHGFQRLILPRDLSLKEIHQIMLSVPEPEYECFLMRNGCRYSDSHCLACHGDKLGSLCAYLDRSKVSFGGDAEYSFKAHDEILFNHHVFSRSFHKMACGLCAIWRLIHMGVSFGKIVGRADGLKSIMLDASVALENIRRASKAESEAEYLSNMVYPSSYSYACYQGLNCYYPEVRYAD